MNGYSFPEVLFAVIVLGIGFIMVAAIFPVAISQSKATMDETTASAVVRDAVNSLTQACRDDTSVTPNIIRMPATGTPPPLTYPGQVRPFDTTNGWFASRGAMISADNPRFAFVPLYRRDGNPAPQLLNQPAPQPPPADSAQLFLILVQCRALQRPGGLPNVNMGGQPISVPARTELAFDRFDVGLDLTAGGPPIENPNNLYPHQVRIRLTDGGVGADILMVNPTRDPGPGATENLPDAIATGAYIVLADDTSPANPARRGRIYRIGVVRDQAATANVPRSGNAGGGNDPYPIEWELQPGSDMRDNTENLTADTNAWVVGRERLPDGSFIGPAQDVGFYTTFISATK